MTNKEMYRKAVEHWFEIWKAFKNKEVDDINNPLGYIKTGKGPNERYVYYTKTGCAYCDKYYNNEADDCLECPIYKNTIKILCYGTPWHAFDFSPSEKTAFDFLEFVRTAPPEGVEIIELKDLEI